MSSRTEPVFFGQKIQRLPAGVVSDQLVANRNQSPFAHIRRDTADGLDISDALIVRMPDDIEAGPLAIFRRNTAASP